MLDIFKKQNESMARGKKESWDAYVERRARLNRDRKAIKRRAWCIGL